MKITLAIAKKNILQRPRHAHIYIYFPFKVSTLHRSQHFLILYNHTTKPLTNSAELTYIYNGERRRSLSDDDTAPFSRRKSIRRTRVSCGSSSSKIHPTKKIRQSYRRESIVNQLTSLCNLYTSRNGHVHAIVAQLND